MPQICILVLVGLPSAGKTCFSRWLLTNNAKTNWNTIHICYDTAFLLEHAQQQANDNEFDYKHARMEIYKLLDKIVNALQSSQTIPEEIGQYLTTSRCSDGNDFLIICDDNHYYRSMRYKLYQLCRRQALSFAQIYFPCDLDTAIARNSQRDGTTQIPKEIIEQMYARMEPPCANQHNWELNTFVQQSDQESYVNTVLPFIAKSFQHVSSPVPSSLSKTTQPTTLQHQLDLLLRNRIKDLIAAEPSVAQKRARAVTLNDKRKNILTNFKRSTIFQNGCGSVEDVLDFVDLL